MSEAKDLHDSGLRVVLIGGHHDGHRMTLPKPEPVILMGWAPPVEMKATMGPTAFDVHEELYTCRMFRANGVLFRLYVLEGMSEAEALASLLRNYRPEGEES